MPTAKKNPKSNPIGNNSNSAVASKANSKTNTRSLNKKQALADSYNASERREELIRKAAERKQAKIDEKLGKTPKYDVMQLTPIIRGLSRSFFSPIFEGTIPEGGCVLAANHQTDIDGFLLSDLGSINGRRCRFLGKVELFTAPVAGWFMRAGRHIPVIRYSERAKESLAPAISAAKQGEVVAIFPEGSLTQDPNYWPMTARPGAGVIALTAGVPLIPVMIEGAYNLRPTGWGGLFHIRWKELRTPVKVRVLPAVDTSDLSGPEDAKIAVDRAMKAITEAISEERGEPAPERLWDDRVDGKTWFW